METDKLVELVLAEVKEIRKDQTQILTTLAAQHATLVEHVKRTDLVEHRVEKLEDETVPLKLQVSRWSLAGKVFVAATGLLGAVAALYRLLS